MIRGISPVLWDSLHQLHAQGCPIELAEMYRSAAPVHLENKLPYAAHPMAPVGHGFLLALRLVLHVRSALTVERLEMAADWFPARVECFRFCRWHHGDLCVQSDKVHLRQSGVSPHLMNFGALPRYIEAGTELDGLTDELRLGSLFFPPFISLPWPIFLCASDRSLWAMVPGNARIAFRLTLPITFRKPGRSNGTRT